MQPRPDPRRRLVLAHLIHSAGRLDLGPRAPSSDKGTGERRIREVDRDGVIEHATSAGGCDSPTVRAPVRVEPGGYLSVALAETGGRDANPDTHREAPLG